MKPKNTRNRGRPQEVEIRLKKPDSKALTELLKSGHESARVFKRAMLLKLMNDGFSANQAAARIGVSANTARRTARKYEIGGLMAALYEGKRPGKRRLLKVKEEQAIVALACSAPSEGIARWSTRLLAKEAVERGIVIAVSHDTILRLLQNHDLKPWREKNVVRRRPRC
jgi:transposase